MKEEHLETKLERARIQRFIALKNAFATIDAFAIPSLDPQLIENYEAVKKNLLTNYGETIDWIKEYDYKFTERGSAILKPGTYADVLTQQKPSSMGDRDAGLIAIKGDFLVEDCVGRFICPYSKEKFRTNQSAWILNVTYLPCDDPLFLQNPLYKGTDIAYFHHKENAMRWKAAYAEYDYFCPYSKEGFMSIDKIWIIPLKEDRLFPVRVDLRFGSIYSIRKECAIFHTREAAIQWLNENVNTIIN